MNDRAGGAAERLFDQAIHTAGDQAGRQRAQDDHAALTAAIADQLTTAQVAAHVGITPATFRSYVAKGIAPAADGWYDARTPWWYAATIEEWRQP